MKENLLLRPLVKREGRALSCYGRLAIVREVHAPILRRPFLGGKDGLGA